jgi:hypothetical protein
MVEADLPEACSLSSLSRASSKDDNISVATNNRKRASDTLAEIIKDTFNKDKGNKLAECKMHYMSTELERKNQVYTLCYEEKKLKEWLVLRDNIKKLRAK